MRIHGTRGFSLIETLVALALIASVSAALLPAIALASRLHRDSAIETEAAVIAAAHLARLASRVASADVSMGGSLDGAEEGWRALVDVTGTAAEAQRAVFEVRWQVASVPASPGVVLLAVRVLPMANRAAAITLTAVVPDA